MNYTAFTAVIITVHHLAAGVSFFTALILTAIIYGLFIRKRKSRLIAVIITFLVALILGASLAEEMYNRKPLGIEIVNAG